MNRIIFLLILVFFVTASFAVSKDEKITFTDVKKQTEEFIGYYNTIKLTPDQQKVKEEALGSIPAPCCKEYTMATCCCPCNLAKSVWGLSNYLITEKNYDAARLKKAVQEWIEFIHPGGYKGDSCSNGRCGQSFANDGCGGMKDQVVY